MTSIGAHHGTSLAGRSTSAPEPKKIKLQLGMGASKLSSGGGGGAQAAAHGSAASASTSSKRDGGGQDEEEEGEVMSERGVRAIAEAQKLLNAEGGALPAVHRDDASRPETTEGASGTAASGADDGGYLERSAKLERARKVPPPSSSRKVASNISKWTDRQGELHAAIDAQQAEQAAKMAAKAAGIPTDSVNALPVANAAGSKDGQTSQSAAASETATSASTSSEPAPPKDPGADYDFTLTAPVIACLLCNRAFKQATTLERHVAESELHKTELGKEAARIEGYARKLERQSGSASAGNAPAGATSTAGAGRGFKPIAATSVSAAAGQADESGGSSSGGGAKYRNRAAERRAVFGADNPSAKPQSGPKVFDGPVAATAAALGPAAEPVRDLAKEGIDTETNRGAKLLELMGWKKDQGLGASGEGRVAPIETALYGERVGLGAAKPRDASAAAAAAPRSKADGWSYQEALKDRARDHLAGGQ